MNHHSSFTRRLGSSLALVASLGAAACGGSGDTAGTAPGEPAPEAPTFPYALEDGAIACGPGRYEGEPLEYYHFDRLTLRLESSSVLAALAAERGVTTVDSCEAARRVGEAMAEIARNEDPATHPSETAFEETLAEMGEALPGEEPPVDKIADGIVDRGRPPR